ncbi:MAG TPA: hypothetical protein VGO47_06975 [Chlamydiales bacterium]|nr:hypothetical protein [Chlamydiales bacterium]
MEKLKAQAGIGLRKHSKRRGGKAYIDRGLSRILHLDHHLTGGPKSAIRTNIHGDKRTGSTLNPRRPERPALDQYLTSKNPKTCNTSSPTSPAAFCKFLATAFAVASGKRFPLSNTATTHPEIEPTL